MCKPSSWIHHGVESYALENEGIPEIVVPNSVLSKNFFVSMDFILGCFDGGLLLLLPLPPLLLSRRLGFSRFVEATVSRCMLEGWTFVSHYSNLVNHTRDVLRQAPGRFEVHIIEILFLFCAILNRNSPSTNYQNSSGNRPEYSMMALVLSDNFEFFLQFLNWSKNRRIYFLMFLKTSWAMK